MKKSLFLTLAIILALAGTNAASLSKHIVDYKIKVKLDTENKALQGEEILTWLNDSDQPISELHFHLYLNAFKNNQTTFMKEGGVSHRGFRWEKENVGYCDVSKIAIVDGPDLTQTMEYIQPDDGNTHDQTVMRVRLPQPIAPQEKITLTISFYSKLPRVFARTGFYKDFYMVGQWFPKIGVFWKGKWNCHQFHRNTEFFADFGVYEVEITVPEKFIVGATGVRKAEIKNADGTKTCVHFQADVHDFAWTACPDYVEFREKFVLADPPVDTEMILLIHRRHLNHKDRYRAALRNGLEFYSQSYGPYPYQTITLVDPAPGAMGAGGMEYPTLFTGGTISWISGGLRMPEMVTIHEFGHGYWYGIVASNEFEEAWLDEGINSYSEIKAMTKYYGAQGSLIDLGCLKISDLCYHQLQVIGSSKLDPVLKNSWEYYSGGSYGLNVYSKAALMLLTLEKYLGEDAMAKAMKAYFEKWKFRHPTSQDFRAVVEEVSGENLAWFFDQFLSSPDKLDYAVGDVQSREVPEPEGKLEGLSGLEPAQEKKKAVAKETLYKNEVVVERKGELIFPQEILVVFANGEKVREEWDGRERWKRFVYYRPDKLKMVQLDPEGKMVLDVNCANNSRLLEPKKNLARKWGLAAMSYFQHFVSLLFF